MIDDSPYLFDIPNYWVTQAKYEVDQTKFVDEFLYQNFNARGFAPES